MWANVDVAHAQGAAWGRRLRRLRAHWRHEQLTLQMLLATYEHHAAPRGLMKARSRGEESELSNATGQKTPLTMAASTVYFSMDDDGDVLAARPTPPFEMRPQPGVLRHIAAHVVDILPYVQILDVPVPQGRNQVVEFMQTLNTATPVQVIAVPKLSQDKIPQRSAVRRLQKAEQLVEVPTVLSFSSLRQQTAEHIIDIPVPHRRRRGQGGLQGFFLRTELNSTVCGAER